MVRIDAVTFDLWDTLIQEVPGGSAIVAKVRLDMVAGLLASSGSTFPREDLEIAYAMTGDHLDIIWSRAEDISIEEQVRFFLGCLDRQLPERMDQATLADVERVYSESMLQHGPMLLAGATEMLSAVRDSGVRTGLISNTGKTPGSILRTLLDGMGVLDYFDVTTFSNEVRARKPARSIFDLTLEELGVDPERSVHVGDNPWADIDGAKAIGMLAIQVGSATGRGDHLADEYVSSLNEVIPVLESLRRR